MLYRYTVESYKEFYADVQDIWNDLIAKYNFQIEKKDDGEVHLENENCKILLLLGVGQSIYYKFINPKSHVEYDPIWLSIFCGKEVIPNLVGGENYPLTMQQWVQYFSEEDCRGICLIDLPIIKNEILKDWERILTGDFSFEENYVKWEPWFESKRESDIDYRMLSFEDYQKDQLK